MFKKRKNLLKGLATLLCPLLFLSCGEKQINTAGLREAMDSREIARISTAEIETEAYDKGRRLKKELFSLMDDGLTEGEQKALEEEFEMVMVKRDISARDYSSEKEKQIMEAYEYNKQKPEAVEDNVQLIDNQTVLYTLPVTDSSQILYVWSIMFDKPAIVRDISK